MDPLTQFDAVARRARLEATPEPAVAGAVIDRLRTGGVSTADEWRRLLGWSGGAAATAIAIAALSWFVTAAADGTILLITTGM